MRTLLATLSVGFLLLLGGCSVLPTNPVPLTGDAIGPGAGRVGVAMSSVPKVDTFLPGADCLLCLAVAAGANSELTSHAETLAPEGVAELKQRVAELLEAQGTEVVMIDAPFELSKLPKYRGPADQLNAAKKDFRAFKEQYGIEKILVIDLHGIGFKRTYQAYVPTSDPKGWIAGAGYIVNLEDNTYEWYLPVEVLKSADGNWDEAPSFPGLTNAYFQALEEGKDAFLQPFRAPMPAPAVATEVNDVAEQVSSQ